MFCQKCQLDNTQFIIAPPPDSTHHPPLKPSTTVGSLKTKEVQVVRKGSRAPPTGHAPPPPSAPIEATDSNGLSANEQVLYLFMKTFVCVLYYISMRGKEMLLSKLGYCFYANKMYDLISLFITYLYVANDNLYWKIARELKLKLFF